MDSLSASFFDGFWHVVNWPDFEFLLFVISVSVVATFNDWKKLSLTTLVFVLGFLIGTLAAYFDLVVLSNETIVLVQAVILMVLAIFNFTPMGKSSNRSFRLIVGGLLGISGGLRLQESLFSQLFGGNFLADLPAFLIGIEAGLIAAVLFMLIFAWLVANAFGLVKRDWMLILSGAVLGVSLTMFLEALF